MLETNNAAELTDVDLPGDLPADADPCVDLELLADADPPEPPSDGVPEPRPVPGGTAYSWQRPSAELTTWWWGLPEGTRTALAGLHVGDVLSPTTAAAVAAAGLPCPRVPVVVAGRRVGRLVATATLMRTIHLVRMTHSERRLV